MRYVIFTLPPRGIPGPVQSPVHWCSVLTFFGVFFSMCLLYDGTGPPGQVNAVAGKKEGAKQGAVGGILKELGYTEDQVFKF